MKTLPSLLASSRGRLVAIAAVAFGLLFASRSPGQTPITFTTPTTIAATNLTYENYAVTVDATTVTIDGAHTFHSLTIRNGGTVTHSLGTPLHLTITTNATINTGCTIQASGMGFDWTVNGGGPGAGAASGTTYAEGASHGGVGGAGYNRPAPAVRFYGSLQQPVDLGSAGGNYTGSFGGNGGGAIRMTVSGTLRVDGTIAVNGSNGGSYSGGGSGGSVWLDVGTISGFGSVDAIGGNGSSYAGGGGGGRIAVVHSTTLFFGTLRALGGYGNNGSLDGGAGTVFVRDRANPHGDLTIDNFSRSAHSSTEFTGVVTVRDLLVQNNAILSPAPEDPTLHLDVRRNATVAAQGSIAANGRGYDWNGTLGGGPGAGASTGSSYGEGASHGGVGGAGVNRPAPAVHFYGAFDQPSEMGSAGGNSAGNLGGRGGGVVRMTVVGMLRVDGTVSSNGTNGGSYSGGGSGGSVWLDVGTFAGLGNVDAFGGNGSSYAGGGGGGRIAILHSQNQFLGNLRAWGGYGNNGSLDGGAGTVFVRDRANQFGDLTIDNYSRNAHSSTDFTGVVTVRLLTIRNNAFVSHLAGDTTLELDVRGDCTIQTASGIYVNGRGHMPGAGPGAGQSSGTTAGGGGAGHGGLGGRGGASFGGGFVYGDIVQPTTIGSGGGNGQLPNYGGNGGGKVKLSVAGTLFLDGEIKADGANGVGPISSGYGGGGSAGSIWIIAGAVTGGGRISARGGNGPVYGSYSGGGGGGGRIAIDSTNTGGFIGAIEVNGGTGYQNGANGTYYLSSAPDYTHNVLNLVAGATASFEVVGAAPLSLQLFTFSFSGTGTTVLPGYFTLDLDQPQVLGLTLANAGGIAAITVALPGGAGGVRIWSQPVQANTPSSTYRVGNVVGKQVQ